MTGEWRRAIPQEDWLIYERAGFGRKAGLGKKPAVLVIDVQYRTVGDTRLPILESIERSYRTSCGEAGWQAVSVIEKLLNVTRAVGIPTVYPYVAPKSAIDTGRTGEKIPSLMDVPERGYAFVETVRPRAGDLLIPKRHPSAFFGTPLVSYLIDMGIDSVLLTGCTTSGCIRATAVDAFAYNFRCAVVEECVYDRSQVSHQVNLFDIQSKYGDVLSFAETIEYIHAIHPAVAVGKPD